MSDGSTVRRRVATVAPPAAAAAVVTLWLVPGLADTYWVYVLTSGVVAIPIMQSLGVITGRVGVMSLCQLSFAMIGAWVVGWCNTFGVPGGFGAWMVIAGLATVPAGMVLGLPALRLRGVNLAIVTFAFALALDIVFSAEQFPGAESFDFVERPLGFSTDAGYFRFAVLVVLALFVLLHLIDRTRLGASWLELRYSERGAAAHGTNVTASKLAAFALSAFIAGIGGALVVGQSGATTPAPFVAQNSLVYFAIAVVIGVRFWEAAVLAGLIGSLMPVLLDKAHIPENYVSIVFGVLTVFILAGGKGQLGQSEIIRARRDARRARDRLEGDQPAEVAAGTRRSTDSRAPGDAGTPRADPTTQSGAALELRDVTVRFGAVVAVDTVSLRLPSRTVTGLLGPNGAGKSTLINAVTGFLPYSGDVLLDGWDPGALAPHRRARAGLRRSFQQLRVPPTLTAGMFLSVAAGRRLSAEETDEYLSWFDCPAAHVPIGTMDVGGRRVLEVAGLAASRATVLLLDEPAAGQGATETERLGRRIAEIPERTGSAVLLVEHDIDLVRAACDSLVVMDFGTVIASGGTDSVLADPRVTQVYMGTDPTEEHHQ